MQILESRIERNAVRLIYEKLGIKGSKLRTPGDAGYPDRIFWIPGGRPLLVEFKRPREEPDPLQEIRHDELRDLGYNVVVCDNPVDALRHVCHVCLESIYDKHRRIVDDVLRETYE